MDIEIFTLCHYAEGSPMGLTIVNAFDTIYIPKLPAMHPFCIVAARIRYFSGEQGDTAIQLRITSPDRENIVPPIRQTIKFPLKPGAESMSYHLVMNFQGLPIKVYGKHLITFSIHGQDLRTLPLFVTQPTKPKSETEI